MLKRIFQAALTVSLLFASFSAHADVTYKAYGGSVRVSGNSDSEKVYVMLVDKSAGAIPTESQIAYFTEVIPDKDGNYSITFPYGDIDISDYEVRESTGDTTAVAELTNPTVRDLISVDIKMVENTTYANFVAELTNYYNTDVSDWDIKVYAGFFDSYGRLTGAQKYDLGNVDVNEKISIPANSVTMKGFVWQDMKQLYSRSSIPDNTLGNDTFVINCWGDSLTAGIGGNGTSYPGVLETLIGSNVTVNNYGVGGEDTRTIAGRQGGVPFQLSSDVVIPATTTAIPVSLLEGNPIRQGSAGINSCSIGGIAGTLERDGTTNVLEFTRATAGSATPVSKGAAITTAASQTAGSGINIISSGTNDRTAMDKDIENTVLNIVDCQKEMVEKINTEGGKYLIVGTASGVSGDWLDEFKCVEELQAAAFGRNFLNLREVLTDSAIYEEVGIDLTAADLENMSNGALPTTIISNDNIHFNADGYTVVARAIYNKLVSMGLVIGE